jgi:transcriptional regulator with XRE-family HTH domain
LYNTTNDTIITKNTQRQLANEEIMNKMTLSSYYNSLSAPTPPKTDFVKRVSERCGVSMEAVRTWIRGDRRPGDERHYEILAEETGIPKDELFESSNN